MLYSIEAVTAQAREARNKAQRWGKSDEETHIQEVATIIYNHGVGVAMKHFELKAPKIKSIFCRLDCWERCVLAATQMIQLSK